ncbi:DNA helicase [Tanacetum coccineum]
MKTKHRPIKRKLSIDLSMECDGNGVCKKQCPVSLDVLSIGNTTDVNLNGPERRHTAKDSACVRNHDSEVLANATEHNHGDMLTCDNISVEQCEHQERKRPNEALNSTNCQNTDMPNTKRRRMINNNHYGERPLTKGNDQDSSINLMTSLGAKVDNSINNGKGSYVFRILGKIYHWIGAMCLDEGKPPRFLQLYIYDTTNEVNNRMAYFHNKREARLKQEIVEGLIEFLDSHNALVQLFCTARDKYMDANIPEFKVRLYNVVCTRQYELPTAETIGAIVFAESSGTKNNEDGYQADMKLANVPGQSTKANKRMSMNIRLDYIPQKQTNIRNEYLLGIYDAILRGDRDGSDLGLRIVLTATFTRGLRYIYAHYLDALAICRVHGSPSFFITFTCNAKWPEIEEYMKPFPQLTTTNRADIVDRVFEKKVCDYITFVHDSTTFGDVTTVLYTIEFQKRGLPHCHSLLWINSPSKAREDSDVDQYIC